MRFRLCMGEKEKRLKERYHYLKLIETFKLSYVYVHTRTWNKVGTQTIDFMVSQDDRHAFIEHFHHVVKKRVQKIGCFRIICSLGDKVVLYNQVHTFNVFL